MRDSKGRFVKGYSSGYGFQKGHIAWNKGRHPSLEIRQKISASLIGKSPGRQNALKGAEKIRQSKLGAKNHRWNGGRYKDSFGYVYILTPGHPYSRAGYVAEHRLVMEKAIGRYLLPTELVHHKNGIKDDNRLENLELLTRRTHKGNVVCPFCKQTFAIR